MFSFTDCEFLRPRILLPNLKKVSFFSNIKSNQTRGRGPKWKYLNSEILLSGFFLQTVQATYCQKYENRNHTLPFDVEKKGVSCEIMEICMACILNFKSSQDLDEECRFWSDRRSPTSNSPGSLHFTPALYAITDYGHPINFSSMISQSLVWFWQISQIIC
jgi:hypothetical protein